MNAPLTGTELVLRAPEIPDRQTFIGGSDIAAICGVNPYKSPFDVYLEKTGKAPPNVQTEAMHWGTKLERVIAEEYEERRGVVLVKLFDEPMRHSDRPWQGGSPDSLLPSAKLDVEIKAPGLRQAFRYGPPGTDEVPEEHLLQAHWYLSLLDYEEAHIAVLVGGQDFRIYEIRRDRELEAVLLERAYDFWSKHVAADCPPEVTDSERVREWLRRSFPKELAAVRNATEDEALLAKRYLALRAAGGRIEKRVCDMEARFRIAIGEAAGIAGDGFKVTWKKAKDSVKVDWEAAAVEMRATLGLIASSQNVPEDVREIAREKAAEAIRDHTTTRPGSRRLLPRFEGEENEDE